MKKERNQELPAVTPAIGSGPLGTPCQASTHGEVRVLVPRRLAIDSYGEDG